MNTRLIMTLNAIFLGLIGLSLSFLPDEISSYIIGNQNDMLVFTLQLLGALYFAFALLNWMSKGNLIGGIYNKPLAMANFVHFFIGTITLVKGLVNNTGLNTAVWILAALYLIFAILFGVILNRHPSVNQQAKS